MRLTRCERGHVKAHGKQRLVVFEKCAHVFNAGEKSTKRSGRDSASQSRTR